MPWRPVQGSGGTGACGERIVLSPQPLLPQHPDSSLYAVRYAPSWDFPGGPMVKTPHFQCRRFGFDPWSGS